MWPQAPRGEKAGKQRAQPSLPPQLRSLTWPGQACESHRVGRGGRKQKGTPKQPVPTLECAHLTTRLRHFHQQNLGMPGSKTLTWVLGGEDSPPCRVWAWSHLRRFPCV